MYVCIFSANFYYLQYVKKEREESENVDQFNLVESNDIHQTTWGFKYIDICVVVYLRMCQDQCQI